jgi:RNA polymerase sigma-70 factor, ECF subfamily
MFEQVLQSLKDDRDSFKSIFQDYYQPLCHLSIHYLEDEDEAKGVVQEAFVKFWEIRQDLDPNSNIRNFYLRWLKTVA